MDGNDRQVHIRIRNESDQDIRDFWLGAGGRGASSVAYGAIGRGQTSGYKALKPVLASYRKSNFIAADGRRYLNTIDQQQLGVAELAPGRYTFVYRIVDGESLVSLARDD